MFLTAPPAEMFEVFGLNPSDTCRRTTGGWINDTFIVGDPPTTVLQRISSTYFTDAEAVMENLVRIVGHLEWKLKFEDGGGPRWFPKLKSTPAGKPYLFDEEGAIWRAMEYIPGHAPTRDLNSVILRNGAEMYGKFLNRVADLTDPPLRPTVTWYRDLDIITDRFFSAYDTAPPARRQLVADVMDEISRNLAQVNHATEQLGEESLRRRPVHNDTKLANLLLRPASSEMAAVIDLDVAMEGTAAHDFGDLLRSTSQMFAPEPDGPYDRALVREFFAVLSDGFVTGAGDTLSKAEIASLPSAGPRICLELGLRYLTEVVGEEQVLVPGDSDLALRKGRRNLASATGMLTDADALQGLIEHLLEP